MFLCYATSYLIHLIALFQSIWDSIWQITGVITLITHIGCTIPSLSLFLVATNDQYVTYNNLNLTFLCLFRVGPVMAVIILTAFIVGIHIIFPGLTCADRGSVNVLGQELMKNHNIMSSPHMMGYCHYFEFLVPELTVEEHIHLFAEVCLQQLTSLTSLSSNQSNPGLPGVITGTIRVYKNFNTMNKISINTLMATYLLEIDMLPQIFL